MGVPSIATIPIWTFILSQSRINGRRCSLRILVRLRLLLAPTYRSGGLYAHMFRGILHGTDNVLVACAAADVAFERLTNLSFSGVGVVLQKLGGGHNHAGRAEAALQTMFLPEAFLKGVQGAFGRQSLNGGDFTAVGLHCQDGASFDSFAIEVNNTRAALRGI